MGGIILGLSVSVNITGLLPSQRAQMKNRKRAWQEATTMPLPPVPPKKAFVAKFDLPELDNYHGILKASYWAKWRKRSLCKLITGKSWVCAAAMKELADRAKMTDHALVDRVTERLENGADIGVEGRGRLPTREKNSPTVYEHGFAMADTLQDGIVDGYIAGPCTQEEVVALLGPDYTINPMSSREKPNGRLRMIVDASAPHDKDSSVPPWLWCPELPGSINSTIDIEKFPARMSSVARFTRTLWRVGRGALICKIDQSSAYKHQHVRREDLKLQVVEFGGRLFVEMRLMFGTRSSPGIYDDFHKCFLFSVIRLTPGITKDDVEQHLDDVLGVGPPGEDSPIHDFYQRYLKESFESWHQARRFGQHRQGAASRYHSVVPGG